MEPVAWSPPWQPYREPIRVTLRRTVGIALLVASIVALSSRGLARWPFYVLLFLWPSLGGHFIGGTLLMAAMSLTARAFGRDRLMPDVPLWVGGAAFVGIELVAQVFLQLRHRPSFYNGRG
jgi:hypothetical protein